MVGALAGCLSSDAPEDDLEAGVCGSGMTEVLAGSWSGPNNRLELGATCDYERKPPSPHVTEKGRWMTAPHGDGDGFDLELRCPSCDAPHKDVFRVFVDATSLTLAELCGSNTVAAGSKWITLRHTRPDAPLRDSAGSVEYWTELTLETASNARAVSYDVVEGSRAELVTEGTWTATPGGFLFQPIHAGPTSRMYELRGDCVTTEDDRYERVK